MRPVLGQKPSSQYQSPNITITETNSPLDSAWAEARGLFALCAKPQPDVRAIVHAQGEATLLLEKQIEKAGCKISGLFDEMTVTFQDPQQAPVRELLLLVAVNACSPGTTDLALRLVKAMVNNQQIVNHPGWRSAEGRDAVTALYKSLQQLEGERSAAADNRRPEKAYLQKATAETASAIDTLIECASLASPAEENTPEIESILGSVQSRIATGMSYALREAGNFLEADNVDEANKLLDWVLMLAPKQFPELVSQAGAYTPKLLEAIYRRDKLAYTKNAFDIMQKAAVDLQPTNLDLYAHYRLTTPAIRRKNIEADTRPFIEVCANDEDFLRLVVQSPESVALYTRLIGSSPV